MKIIEKNEEANIVEKKSKFIANIFYVESIEEAEQTLKQMQKKYYNAKHNCYAYRIIEESNIIEKSSDDGEPSGTAGMPILDILKGNDLVNCIVIVTRYFGGILLGTGGLVRVYSEATNKVIEKTKLFEIEEGYLAEIVLDYKNFELFNHYCKNEKINVIKKEYNENIKILLEINEEKKEEFCRNSEKLRFKMTNCRILSKKIIRKIH